MYGPAFRSLYFFAVFQRVMLLVLHIASDASSRRAARSSGRLSSDSGGGLLARSPVQARPPWCRVAVLAVPPRRMLCQTIARAREYAGVVLTSTARQNSPQSGFRRMLAITVALRLGAASAYSVFSVLRVVYKILPKRTDAANARKNGAHRPGFLPEFRLIQGGVR